MQAEGTIRQLAMQARAKHGESVEQIAEARRNTPRGALLLAACVGFLPGKLV
ncbi:hypothetical protein [Paraburkholderia sp. SG-MS1]|uniref:hypothetical protein n=1 Tax=Paraburkholderia sp. SG-MS1 TaxID=2023741 RepID=UPI0014457038|nr:hypothetical protein [Paraburkholderia sp. SG-MS1]